MFHESGEKNDRLKNVTRVEVISNTKSLQRKYCQEAAYS
jgi:hypothetical protein